MKKLLVLLEFNSQNLYWNFKFKFPLKFEKYILWLYWFASTYSGLINIFTLNVFLINIKIDGFPTQWRSFLTK